MNSKGGFLGLLSILLLILVISLFVQVNGLKNQIDALENASAKKDMTEEPHKEQLELAVYMNRLQLYMNKLYFAGKVGNKSLTDFYIHEIEETMHEVIEADITDEGIDISSNMAGFGYKQIKLFDENIDNLGFTDFETNYENLINSCNGCHMVTKHPYIIIKNPTNMALDNQDFKPRE